MADTTAQSRSAEPAVKDIAALYAEHYPDLLRVGFLLTGERASAEDLVQDAFLALQQRKLPLIDPPTAAGYLRVSVINGARSRHRRARIARSYLTRQRQESEPGADWSVMLTSEHQQVARCVRRLPKRQQQMIVLRYWSDMSDVDIARSLSVTTATVRATVSKGVAKLAEMMEEKSEAR